MEHISVTEPITPAMERVKQILFRPFDLGKWFAIGFCAWLAGLGERGYSGRFNSSNNNGGDVHQQFEHARGYVLQNLHWILPLVIVLVVFSIALAVLFLWLNCRGKFMFLNCVALNRSEVVEPWKRFAGLANSLFWFRLMLGLAGMVVVVPVVIFMVMLAIPMFRNDSWNFGGIMALISLFVGMFFVSIFFFLIRKLTTDFVVPIMYLRGSHCLAAWREFHQLLSANFWGFVLYLLFQIVISMVIGVMVLAVVLITCCIAGCFLAIPYIGTVLLLPLSTFRRAYSLYYFAQYGPNYNVFPAVAVAPQ